MDNIRNSKVVDGEAGSITQHIGAYQVDFNGNKITFLDTPGHQAFSSMRARGAHLTDIIIIVIAADDGIMPQTIEHFNIFKLLDISKLIIVINKIDLVEDEIIEIIKLEIIELIEETKFIDSQILKVSTLNNQGIDSLKKTLLDTINDSPSIYDKGPFRLPIDRVFSIKGFGTVVTGTVISGNINTGDELSIQPINETIKVRGLNTHNSSTNKISINQRAAINIQKINKDRIKRGFQIVSKNFFHSTKSIIAKIQILDNSDKIISKNQRIRIHLGTSEVIGKIFFFNKKFLKTGENSIGLINLEKPIVASYKDKFIIRNYSPVFTIGGGEIILTSNK